VGSDLVVVFAAIFWREDYRLGRNAVTHDCRSNTMRGDLRVGLFSLLTMLASFDQEAQESARNSPLQ
jgi:hypothetical protein